MCKLIYKNLNPCKTVPDIDWFDLDSTLKDIFGNCNLKEMLSFDQRHSGTLEKIGDQFSLNFHNKKEKKKSHS